MQSNIPLWNKLLDISFNFRETHIITLLSYRNILGQNVLKHVFLSVETPRCSQSFPSPLGAGWVHVLSRVTFPSPHVREQGP